MSRQQHLILMIERSDPSSRVATGAARWAAQRGFRLAHMVLDVGHGDEQARAARRHLAEIRRHLSGATAIIACGGSAVAVLPARRNVVAVAANVDRAQEGVATVMVDNAAVGRTAAAHLLGRGYRAFTVCALHDYPFAVERATAFREAVEAGGGRWVGWGDDQSRTLPVRGWGMEELAPPALDEWIRCRPCAMFACCDGWGQHVLTYLTPRRGIRVPEQLALVGVDNTSGCEVCDPPLSSVSIPWEQMGEQAARVAADMLAGRPAPRRPVLIAPGDVVARQSSDILAIDDPQVSAAIAEIRRNAGHPFTVSQLMERLRFSRRGLERRFRKALGRSVLDEIHIAHVDVAKRLLVDSEYDVLEIAHRSGFSTASRLRAAFRRVTGTTPAAFRRQSVR